jgi:hypothetical protein
MMQPYIPQREFLHADEELDDANGYGDAGAADLHGTACRGRSRDHFQPDVAFQPDQHVRAGQPGDRDRARIFLPEIQIRSVVNRRG